MGLHKESKKIIEQVGRIISEYSFPVTIRQIFYQMVARQYMQNAQKNYSKLSRMCSKGRDLLLLPENKFEDNLRKIEKPPSWTSLKDFFRDVAVSYRKAKWANQSDYVEIWVEKAALKNIVYFVTSQFDVTLFPVRGQASHTSLYQARMRFLNTLVKKRKRCHLYFLGDFDPSGLAIFDNINNYLKEFLPFLRIKRIGLTQNQIAEYKLPGDPAKTSDPNFKKFSKKYGNIGVELDALPPDVLQKLVESTILKHMDMEKFELMQEMEKMEIEMLQEIIDKISL